MYIFFLSGFGTLSTLFVRNGGTIMVWACMSALGFSEVFLLKMYKINHLNLHTFERFIPI